MIKLLVGVQDLSHYAEIQKRDVTDFNGAPANFVWTRHKPKRDEELIESGSIYRVIKNVIMCRQKIIGFDSVEHPVKGKMCLILTETDIVTTRPTARRPFQGWRYLQPDAAPEDIGVYDPDEEQPPEEMSADLIAAGLL